MFTYQKYEGEYYKYYRSFLSRAASSALHDASVRLAPHVQQLLNLRANVPVQKRRHDHIHW